VPITFIHQSIHPSTDVSSDYNKVKCYCFCCCRYCCCYYCCCCRHRHRRFQRHCCCCKVHSIIWCVRYKSGGKTFINQYITGFNHCRKKFLQAKIGKVNHLKRRSHSTMTHRKPFGVFKQPPRPKTFDSVRSTLEPSTGTRISGALASIHLSTRSTLKTSYDRQRERVPRHRPSTNNRPLVGYSSVFSQSSEK